MSIATELQNYNDGLLDSYAAVNTQGGTVPANKNLDNLPTAITSIPTGGGGGGVEEKDINFYDYDGTLVDSWSLAELPDKTELPANPTHTGLTAQGWNWTLADLKTQNTAMDVGQMYAPTDGKMHLFVDVDADHLSPYLKLWVDGTITVDWGDGISESISGANALVSANHTYSSAGSYEVCVDFGAATWVGVYWGSGITRSLLWSSSTNYGVSAYSMQVKELWLPSGVNLRNYSFAELSNLRNVAISKDVNLSSGNSVFAYCMNLRHITIPTSTTQTPSYLCSRCYSLESISFPKIVSYINIGCVTYSQLKRVTLPNVTTIMGSTFEYNYSLEKAVINGVTLANANSAFANAYSLKEVEVYQSSGITTIASGIFSFCRTLRTFIIPNTVTRISSSAFAETSSINFIKMPNSITTIQSQAFNTNSYPGGLATIDFTEFDHIPTVASDSFAKPLNLIIKVPAALYNDWIAETNWAGYASYIVGV